MLGSEVRCEARASVVGYEELKKDTLKWENYFTFEKNEIYRNLIWAEFLEKNNVTTSVWGRGGCLIHIVNDHFFIHVMRFMSSHVIV